MGEVYRARDTRLDRTVAIKVLTGALAADAESRARFEHEARAIAALNDPHICTLFDIGHDGDLDYLVLEYLEGETLADQLQRSPVVPVAEALAIAIQIGDALDRAHRAGIVASRSEAGQRDADAASGRRRQAPRLRSGRPDGRRPSAGARRHDRGNDGADAGRDSSADARAPAATSGLVGTIQYMAPERLDGREGDHRADIFAFGCVLYEMLAGRKAFEGANVLTAIAAIKSSEPPPVAALQAHPLLDHVLRRCLAKDPEERWQSIRDVTERAALDGRPSAVAIRRRDRRLRARARLANRRRALRLVVAIAAIGAAVQALRGRGSAGRSVSRSASRWRRRRPTIHRCRCRRTARSSPSSRIRTASRCSGSVRSTAVENHALAGTEGASFPFWSPDGRAIGFFAGNKLKRIDVAGGAPIVLADAPNARGGDWNADGVILFSPGVQAPIMRVSARGGAVEQVTQPNAGSGPGRHRVPQFLPDGKRFLFSSTLGGPATNGVYLASLDKTPPVRLLPGDTGGRFAPPDKLLAIGQGALQVYDFDVAIRRPCRGNRP